jgi:uncharacterized protein (UPF0333 family)
MNMIIPKHFMLQQRYDSHSSGFVVLLSVLIVSAIATAIVVSLLLLGIGSSRTSFALEQSNQAKALANTCAEEALQQISDSTPFTGTGSLNLGQGSCDYEVTSQGGQDRTITAEGVVGSVVRRVWITINKINPDIDMTRWEELAEF